MKKYLVIMLVIYGIVGVSSFSAEKKSTKKSVVQTVKIEKQYYEDGTLKYEGTLKNGKAEGEGKLYDNNGNISYMGTFKNGLPNGTGKMYDDKGKLSYIGEVKNGMPSGDGRWVDGESEEDIVVSEDDKEKIVDNIDKKNITEKKSVAVVTEEKDENVHEMLSIQKTGINNGNKNRKEMVKILSKNNSDAKNGQGPELVKFVYSDGSESDWVSYDTTKDIIDGDKVKSKEVYEKEKEEGQKDGMAIFSKMIKAAAEVRKNIEEEYKKKGEKLPEYLDKVSYSGAGVQISEEDSKSYIEALKKIPPEKLSKLMLEAEKEKIKLGRELTSEELDEQSIRIVQRIRDVANNKEENNKIDKNEEELKKRKQTTSDKKSSTKTISSKDSSSKNISKDPFFEPVKAKENAFATKEEAEQNYGKKIVSTSYRQETSSKGGKQFIKYYFDDGTESEWRIDPTYQMPESERKTLEQLENALKGMSENNTEDKKENDSDKLQNENGWWKKDSVAENSTNNMNDEKNVLSNSSDVSNTNSDSSSNKSNWWEKGKGATSSTEANDKSDNKSSGVSKNWWEK